MDAAWLIAEPEAYDEYDLGPLKTGKEAEVFLVERVTPDGRACLLAHKRYRPRAVTHKGELQELGFQRVANFVNDRAYRDGRTLGNSRDPRAAAKKSRHGKLVLRDDWPDNEFAMLERLADAGVNVPFPVARTADGVLMQYVGDRTMAAPRLVHAGLLARAGRRMPPPNSWRTCTAWSRPASCMRTCPSTTCSGGRNVSGSSTSRRRSTSASTGRPSTSCTVTS